MHLCALQKPEHLDDHCAFLKEVESFLKEMQQANVDRQMFERQHSTVVDAEREQKTIKLQEKLAYQVILLSDISMKKHAPWDPKTCLAHEGLPGQKSMSPLHAYILMLRLEVQWHNLGA